MFIISNKIILEEEDTLVFLNFLNNNKIKIKKLNKANKKATKKKKKVTI